WVLSALGPFQIGNTGFRACAACGQLARLPSTNKMPVVRIAGVAVFRSKIDRLITFFPPDLLRRCSSHPAFSDLDCGCVRDNWSAYSHSNIRATDNCGPASSFSIRGFPDL